MIVCAGVMPVRIVVIVGLLVRMVVLIVMVHVHAHVELWLYTSEAPYPCNCGSVRVRSFAVWVTKRTFAPGAVEFSCSWAAMSDLRVGRAHACMRMVDGS